MSTVLTEEKTTEEKTTEKTVDPIFKEEVLDQFLGDESFPVTWNSELEKHLFWVYDDLHNPQPLSPMHEDIGLWTMSCDHMFRRFGTPFATDWIPKNVNGYLYTAQVPGNQDFRVDRCRGRHAVRGSRLPSTLSTREQDRDLPQRGAADLWRRVRRVVAHPAGPGDAAQLRLLEGMLDKQDELTLMELACLLEDAIDMHDRHWKIHWMLNFAQLSATLNLRAVMEKTHGKVDEALLGRLQNSAKDRNWDSIEALWKMKEEAKGDCRAGRRLQARDRR